MDVALDPINGLYCIANDFIRKNKDILKLPKEKTICNQYIFHFKFELYNILLTIPDLYIDKDTCLVIFNTLYQMKEDKTFIKNYIKENNLTIYEDLEFEPIKDLKNYFPKMVLGKSSFKDIHFALLSEKLLGPDIEKKFQNDFNQIKIKINQSEHKVTILHMINNLEDFLYVYGLIASRAIIMELEDYDTLINYLTRKKNIKISK